MSQPLLIFPGGNDDAAPACALFAASLHKQDPGLRKRAVFPEGGLERCDRRLTDLLEAFGVEVVESTSGDAVGMMNLAASAPAQTPCWLIGRGYLKIAPGFPSVDGSGVAGGVSVMARAWDEVPAPLRGGRAGDWIAKRKLPNAFAALSREFGPCGFDPGVLFVADGPALARDWQRALADIPSWLELSERDTQGIALGVELAAANRPLQSLEQAWNFPADRRPVVAGAVLCRHGNPDSLREDPVLAAEVLDLAERFPELTELFEAHANWTGLIKPRKITAGIGSQATTKTPPRRDLIVTGIPRSGTSYLCNLLHRYSNCVVINEPAEVFDRDPARLLPWQVARFHRTTRGRILDGLPVMNKLKDGRVVEDTTSENLPSEYRPAVDNAHFVLGTKFPLFYLARLPELKRVLPDARIVVCVRDPFDTIASWKKSFASLAGARPLRFAESAALTPNMKRAAEFVCALEDAEERRAAWWRLLAERILQSLPDVVLIRYSELVGNPAGTLERVFEGFDPGKQKEAVEPSDIRGSGGSLSASERAWVSRYCADAAAELGVWPGFLER